VKVMVDDSTVTVEISDNGVGVDPRQARSGLVNLGERAAAASARSTSGAPTLTEPCCAGRHR